MVSLKFQPLTEGTGVAKGCAKYTQKRKKNGDFLTSKHLEQPFLKVVKKGIIPHLLMK
jgi:hypothetical protein